MTEPAGATGPENAGALPPNDQNCPEQARPPRSLFWRWPVPALKILLAGGLLYYVLATKIKPDTKDEFQRLFLESPYVLGIAILSITMQLLIGTQRVRILLAAQGFRIGYFNMLRLTYLGAFFDTFMFTSVGGDAVKAVYLARETPAGQRVESVSVLVLDRLFGLLGLVSLMLLITIWHLGILWANPTVRPFVPFLFLFPFLLFVGTGMLLSQRVYSWPAMQFVLRKLPGGGFIVRAYFSLQKFRDRPLVLLSAFGLSLCVHTMGVVCGYVLVHGMGQQPQFGPFLVAWYISNFICSFTPMGGIGVGQLVYDDVFMTIAGVPNGLVLATAVQATYVLTKLPGLVAWIASREHPEGR